MIHVASSAIYVHVLYTSNILDIGEYLVYPHIGFANVLIDTRVINL